MARSSALTDADSSEDSLSKEECKMAPGVQASRYAVAIHSQGEQHEVKENYSYLKDECYDKVSFMLRSGFRSYPNDFSSKDYAYQKYENRIYCVVTFESREASGHVAPLPFNRGAIVQQIWIPRSLFACRNLEDFFEINRIWANLFQPANKKIIPVQDSEFFCFRKCE